MKKVLLPALLILTSFILVPSSVSAGIFKCTNKAGNIYYNDKPCPSNQKEKKIRAVKDPINGYVPLLKTFDLNQGGKSSNKVAKQKRKPLNNDYFGTSKYKGKETEKQHAGRMKYEQLLLDREAMEKSVAEEKVADELAASRDKVAVAEDADHIHPE